jgi:hypothetical protein
MTIKKTLLKYSRKQYTFEHMLNLINKASKEAKDEFLAEFDS